MSGWVYLLVGLIITTAGDISSKLADGFANKGYAVSSYTLLPHVLYAYICWSTKKPHAY